MFARLFRAGSSLPVQTAPCAPAKGSPAKGARARLQVEALENRLVPTTLTYPQWQEQRFHVDDVPVANVSVQASGAPQAVNQSFGSLIGLDRAFADYAYRGQGESVAIIDTGIDYNHRDLGGGWGHRVIAGYDFVNGDADPMDDDGHGTHVAGIIGGSSTTYSGVAPEVNFIALKVLDASGGGSFGDVELALRWVAQHQAQYNIVAVNLSLGSGNYASNPFDYIDDEFAALRSRDVFIAVAAGNAYYTFGGEPGLSFPAVSTEVVSVGAVWAKNSGQASWMSGARDFSTGPDRIASYSQRGAGLSLMAPGGMITSTYLDGAYQEMAGTSMATPVVAGAAALVRQALAAKGLPADQDAILAVLRSSGVTITDGDDEDDNVANTSLSFPRLDVHAALQSVAGQVSDGSPSLAPIGNQSVSPGGTRVVTLQATDPDGDALTFSARVVTAGGGADLYELRQQFSLSYLGDYHYNVWGAQEKWLGGSGGAWYCLLPGGELRRWAGSMGATLEADNLLVSLSASVYTDPSLLWNAQPVSATPATLALAGAELTITPLAGFSGSFQVEVAVSDGSHQTTRNFIITVGNLAPVWTTVADQTMKRRQARTVALTAADPEGAALTFSAVAVALDGNATPPATLTLQGSKLTISPAASFSGAFRVELTASDGTTTASTSFLVTVQNTAPALPTPANPAIRRGGKATVTLAATDADGDVLTYSFKTLGGNYAAYELDQRLTLSYQGSYYQNLLGLKEKWMTSVNEDGVQDWYCILPSGEVRRRGATKAATLSTGNFVAKLDATYYANPQLLWNAQLQLGPAATFKLVGNKLTITPPAKYAGTFFVEAAVSDGFVTTRKLFSIRVV